MVAVPPLHKNCSVCNIMQNRAPEVRFCQQSTVLFTADPNHVRLTCPIIGEFRFGISTHNSHVHLLQNSSNIAPPAYHSVCRSNCTILLLTSATPLPSRILKSRSHLQLLPRCSCLCTCRKTRATPTVLSDHALHQIAHCAQSCRR